MPRTGYGSAWGTFPYAGTAADVGGHPTQTLTPAYKSTTASSGTTSPAAINKPAGVAVGDLIILFIEWDFDNALAPTDVTVPTGFTLRAGTGWTELSWLEASFVVATRIADGSEGSTFTATFANGALNSWRMWAVAFSGLDDFVTATTDNGDYMDTNTSAILPSLTMTTAGTIIAFLDPDGTPSLPAGMTNIANSSSLRIAYQNVSAGATGTRTSTFTSSGSYAGMLVGFESAVLTLPTASDTLAPAITETRTLQVSRSVTDTLAAAIVDTSAVVVVGLVKTAVDTLALTVGNIGSVYAPNVTVELWEAGVFVANLGNYSTLTETVLSVPFASTLLADPSGADVEIRLTGTSTDIGAIEWNATYADIIVTGEDEPEPPPSELVESWGFIQM